MTQLSTRRRDAQNQTAAVVSKGVSNWKLVAEHMKLRPTADVPESLRRVLSRGRYRITHYVILRDPELPQGQNWLRVHESTEDDGLEFLQAFTENTSDMVRYYLPTLPGTGFLAEEPIYEGHWRAASDEESELPWPAPDPDWTTRGAFLQKLDEAESAAFRVAYRGASRCRLCGQANGHIGLRLDRWEWPVGFRHYISEHEVRPSEAFEAFIVGLKLG